MFIYAQWCFYYNHYVVKKQPLHPRDKINVIVEIEKFSAVTKKLTESYSIGTDIIKKKQI